MDFTKIICMSNTCKNKNIIMDGAGGQFGSRISFGKLKCPECGLTIAIIPLKKDFEYEFKATTEEERIAERIQKAKEKSELELAKTITRIQETGF